jgi:hypothetical protein
MANPDNDLSFAEICSLLDGLEALRYRYRAPGNRLSLKQFIAKKTSLVDRWCKHFEPAIKKDSDTILATLSLLFPDLQTQRTYSMQEHVLSKIVSRILRIGVKGENELRNWRLNDGDFGAAMKKVMEGRVI